jgi:hypothetical protein
VEGEGDEDEAVDEEEEDEDVKGVDEEEVDEDVSGEGATKVGGSNVMGGGEGDECEEAREGRLFRRLPLPVLFLLSGVKGAEAVVLASSSTYVPPLSISS